MTDSEPMAGQGDQPGTEMAARIVGIESRIQVLRDRVESGRCRPLDALSVAALGHELANLLTPAIARTQRALRQPDLDEATRRDLEAVLVATRRATELGDLMLAASGGDERGCDLAAVASEVAALLSCDGVTITTGLPAGVRTTAPEPAVRHTLINLVGNAIRAMGDGGGLIDLCGGRSSWHGVWLEVADTGPGMDEATSRRLFDIGVGRHGGGLGLAIGRRLIEQHGGTLTLERNSPEGCVFRLELPRAADQRDRSRDA